jgi:hypothetical protein
MKLNILFLLFVAFMIICQDNVEHAEGGGSSQGMGGGGGGAGAPGGRSAQAGPGSGGGMVGRSYGFDGSLDNVYQDMNPYQGRIGGAFHFSSPESGNWQHASPVQKTTMLNVAGVGNAKGIPHLPKGIMQEQYPQPLQSFNLIK